MTETHPFVTYLEGLRDNRGALAALRRGLAGAPGTVPETYRYVVPWLPEDISRRREEAYFLVASLFAYHSLEGGSGNMGDHYARARAMAQDDTAIERRFTNLLATHPEDLGFCLRQAISFLRSKEIPVNWQQLLKDFVNWGHPERFVQRNWARSFWGRGQQAS